MKNILPLILILNFGSLFSQSKGNKLELNDTWFGGESESNGKPVIIRGRENLKNFIDSKEYNEHIEFVWENGNGNGKRNSNTRGKYFYGKSGRRFNKRFGI